MKNFLIYLLGLLLGMLFAPFYGIVVTAWIWLPILMDHWSGIIIGIVILIGGQILYDKFLGDN